MEEKKFIAYSRKWKKLIKPDNNEEYTLHICFSGGWIWRDSADDENPIFLQYTGCNDIDGNEIYEGFVIESVKEGLIGRYYVEDIIEFHLWAYRNSIDTHLSHRIIGNVYENKELKKFYLS